MKTNLVTISKIIDSNSKLATNQTLLKELNKDKSEKVLDELNDLIYEFNKATIFSLADNAKHLKSIIKVPLPNFDQVIEILENNPTTLEKVVTEFNESKYLNEVWKIKNIEHLYINLLILIYRTTLLNHFVYLRHEEAQISSAIEEIAALKALNNEQTKIFEATKHWISNWKEEEFSEQLFTTLKASRLL